jgi:DNA polymerase
MHSDYETFNKDKIRCRNCPVGSVYNCVVPSDGNKSNPKLLIIGEAPGADEIKIGKPFVGKCGKLLRETLNECGINEDNSLITNILPCRPERNKFPNNKNLVQNCVDMWLLEEISLVKPKGILLVGSKPLKLILELDQITKNRGVFHVNKEISGVETVIMPIYHPSYVQRKQYMKEGPQILQDFKNDIKRMSNYIFNDSISGYFQLYYNLLD